MASWKSLPLKERLTKFEYERLAKIIYALEFYADPMTYFAISFLPDRPCGDFVKDFQKIEGRHRPGKRARKALRIVYEDLPDATSGGSRE